MNETRKDIERGIIGCLIAAHGVDGAAPATVAVREGVLPSWFEDDAFAAIFHILARRVAAGTIDKVDALAAITEASELESDKTYKRGIGELAQSSRAKVAADAIEGACNLGHLEWYISRLRTYASETSLSLAFKAALRNWAKDPLGAIAKIMDAITRVSKMIAGRDGENAVDTCIEALEKAEEEAYHMRVDPAGPRDLNWIPGLAVMWSPLTRLFLGMSPRFHIVAARPSVGKTMFAINLVRYWIDSGKKVLINSLDMPPEDMVDRMRTEKSRVSIAKKRYTPTRDDLSRLHDASAWVRKSGVQVCEVLYVEDLCMSIAMKAAAKELDIVVIDYLQLLQSHNVDNSNEYERVSYCAEFLKRTANRVKIPIVCLSQLNRGGAKVGDDEPDLKDLRGSGAIEQAASTILFLHRDQRVLTKWQTQPPFWFYENRQYGEAHAAETMDPIWLILAKNQNGPTGRLPMVVFKPYFCAKLGDFNAKPVMFQEGQGATRREVADWSLAFSRIHADWRHDSWEKSLEKAFKPEGMDGNVRILLPEPQIG